MRSKCHETFPGKTLVERVLFWVVICLSTFFALMAFVCFWKGYGLEANAASWGRWIYFFIGLFLGLGAIIVWFFPDQWDAFSKDSSDIAIQRQSLQEQQSFWKSELRKATWQNPVIAAGLYLLFRLLEIGLGGSADWNYICFVGSLCLFSRPCECVYNLWKLKS